MAKRTLTIALMDAPYESANLTTAFRILDVAARRGHDINVFAYEGAAALAFARPLAATAAGAEPEEPAVPELAALAPGDGTGQAEGTAQTGNT